MKTKFLAMAIAAALAACAHQAAEQKSTQVAPVTQAAPLSWYRLPDSEYSVLMPPRVKAGERDKTIPKGEVKINFAQAMPQGAAGNYFVSCAHFPDGALDPGASATILDQVQESTLREMGASPVSSKDLTIDGMPGREFSARKGSEGNILGRIAVGQQRIFTVIGTYTSPQPPDPLLKFVGSLSRREGAAQSSLR